MIIAWSQINERYLDKTSPLLKRRSFVSSLMVKACTVMTANCQCYNHNSVIETRLKGCTWKYPWIHCVYIYYRFITVYTLPPVWPREATDFSDENNPENKAQGKIQYMRSGILDQPFPFFFLIQITIQLSCKAFDYLPVYEVLITSLACDFCNKSVQHLIRGTCPRIKKRRLKFIVRVPFIQGSP